MRLVVLIATLLWSLSAFCQPAPIDRRAMAIAGLAKTPNNPMTADLKWWWVASDNAIGTNTSWVDRIEGFTLLSTYPHAPTNAGNYLQFTGTEVISNTTAYSKTPDFTVGFIVDSKHPWGFQQYIVAFNGAAIPHGIANYNSDLVNYYVNAQGGTLFGPIVTDRIIDYVAVYTSLLWTTFTNGIACRTLVEGVQDVLQGNPFCIGSAPDVGLGDTLNGKVYEVLVWSNNISSTTLSNFHYYATNTYGFTP